MDETLVPRWVPYTFALLGLALIPGIARVSASAPPLHLVTHWRLAWGGFDVVGVAGLRLAGSVPSGPASAAPSPKFARTSTTSAALAEGD